MALGIGDEDELVAQDEIAEGPGRDGDFEDAGLDPREVDLHLGDLGLIGLYRRLLGRRSRGGSRGRALGWRLFGLCLELVGRSEGEARLGREAEGIDLGCLVEIGFALAGYPELITALAESPGARDDALEKAVGKEIRPFSVPAPGRRVAFDPLVGEGRRCVRNGSYSMIWTKEFPAPLT